LRVLIHSAPPWAPSGYGLQARFLARALKNLGHKPAISAFGGVHAEGEWKGIPILPCGTRPYGNGVVAGNYAKWRADLLILLGDLWVMEPGQFEGLNFMPWLPIDCDPLSVMDKDRLTRLAGPGLHPAAMSEFGANILAGAGIGAPVLPHCTPFRPDPARGAAWRRENGIPDDLFLITKVGVNSDDDRKAFAVTLQAFAAFARAKVSTATPSRRHPRPPTSPTWPWISASPASTDRRSLFPMSTGARSTAMARTGCTACMREPASWIP